MSYNSKNHMEQGGEKWVIGGTLEVLSGASVTGLSADPLLPATDTTLGGVKAATKTETDTVSVAVDVDGTLFVPTYPEAITPAANQADSIAEDTATLATDFNALLAKLKAAGLMVSDEI